MYKKAEENSITCIQVIRPQAFLEHIIVLMQLPLHASESVKTALSIYIIITVATANDKSKNILTWNGDKSLQLKTNSRRNPPLHKNRANESVKYHNADSSCTSKSAVLRVLSRLRSLYNLCLNESLFYNE